MLANYFPQGIAEGDAFLGRENEISRLTYNLKSGRHTLLLSPRRYGKTSLARQAIIRTQLAYAEVDLFLAIDDRSIETRFLNGIEALIQNLSGAPEQWLNALVNFFKKADKKWTIGMTGFKLELVPETHTDVPENLMNALNALEHILAEKKQQALLFIDEFQEINKLEKGKAIEGAVRHFAQSSKYLVFIFSGSNRHLLAHMFGDRTRPLYNLCDWINLSRLEPELYRTYLNTVAQKTWGTFLPQTVFEKIIAITACHPEATYALCAALWQYCQNEDIPPGPSDVYIAWKNHVKERLKQTRISLASCSSGQLKVLILIALDHVREITGKNIQKKLNLTSPSIVGALNVLESQDLIEKLEGNTYRIIDPVIKTTLVEYYAEYLD